MKGIILTGGKGTRLYPASKTINKGLLPVYDKPMIYYSLSTLLYSGIRDVLIISTQEDLPLFQKLLKDGSQLGCNFSYKIQPEPNGLAQAFVLGEEFIGNSKVALILGDNIFYMKRKIVESCVNVQGGIVFGYHVNDPERYGVVEYDKEFKVLSIEEKPINPKSNYAVPGMYIYDNSVINYAKTLKPSKRGELEITDINKIYLNNNKLKVNLLGRGVAWLDTGKPNSLFEASTFISYIEARQGLKISCIEEVAYNMGYISEEKLREIVRKLPEGCYQDYLKSFIELINS